MAKRKKDGMDEGVDAPAELTEMVAGNQ